MRVLAVSTVPDVASLIRSNDLSQRVLCGSERGPLRFPSPRVAKRSGRGREGKGREGKGREGGKLAPREHSWTQQNARPPPPTPPRHSLREWEEGRTRGAAVIRFVGYRCRLPPPVDVA